MTLKELYTLAKEKGACLDGLAWLAGYMAKHPTHTASQLFLSWKCPKHSRRSAISVNKCIECMRISAYLSWSFIHLLDWSEFDPCWGYHSSEAMDWRMRTFGTRYLLDNSQLCEALARAFEED